MVLTATTTAGPFQVTPTPNRPTRTLGRSPMAGALHWVGTMDGIVLEGDLERGLETFQAFVPEGGSLYTLIGLGLSDSEFTGFATTSVPTTLERDGEGWRKTPGFPLPPRVRDCAAAAAPDDCGHRRWASPRTDDLRWNLERPWEARYAPYCNVVFLWDGHERCMRLAAPDLERIDGEGRLLATDLDQEGRRITVGGTGAQLYEGWLDAP
jgi:hypothetical protein